MRVGAPSLPDGPLDERAVVDLYEQTGGLRHGHFVLSSGRHSDTYLQSAALLQWPAAAERLGQALAEPYRGMVDLVASPAVGGLVIGHEVARALGVRLVFAERSDGTMTLRRSFAVDPGERALVVEDVVSTGGSVLEVRDLLASAGAEVPGIAAIVDRLGDVPGLPVPLRALAKVRAAMWAAGECPLCRAGQPVESPGSRRLTARRG
jgi:orotate phosphoribosyltransferase